MRTLSRAAGWPAGRWRAGDRRGRREIRGDTGPAITGHPRRMVVTRRGGTVRRLCKFEASGTNDDRDADCLGRVDRIRVRLTLRIHANLSHFLADIVARKCWENEKWWALWTREWEKIAAGAGKWHLAFYRFDFMNKIRRETAKVGRAEPDV